MYFFGAPTICRPYACFKNSGPKKFLLSYYTTMFSILNVFFGTPTICRPYACYKALIQLFSY